MRTAIVIVLVVLVCGCMQQDVRSCISNSDCIKVDAGCCGCTEGGKATSINRKFAEQWNANLTENCREIACIQAISDDPSCFAEPVCRNSMCTLEP